MKVKKILVTLGIIQIGLGLLLMLIYGTNILPNLMWPSVLLFTIIGFGLLSTIIAALGSSY